MEENGASYTSVKCSAKWKSLRERFTQIQENLRKGPKGRKTPWPFYEKMNKFCGEDDRNTLEHVQDVGACGSIRKNRRDMEQQEAFTPKKKLKSRVFNAESLYRLIQLEEKNGRMDEEVLKTLREQAESRKRKDDAMVEAAKSFQEVSKAIILSLTQQR